MTCKVKKSIGQSGFAVTNSEEMKGKKNYGI